ncbi:hypothetical protein SMICM17S_09412 [Streptomyces microflavus]
MNAAPHPRPALPSRRSLLGGLLAGAALAAAPALATPAHATARPAATPAPPGSPTATRPLLIGTYTSAEGGGTGIGTATYDTATGAITPGPVITGVENPSYLALHPSGATVYAVAEQDAGAVTAVALAPDGTYEVLGTHPTGGSGPTHLSVHPSGHWLLSANYSSGSVAVHPIAADGSLGERTDLVTHSSPPPGPGQNGPHAHQIVTAPNGGHVLAVDLGTDTVYTYRLDESAGTLTEVSGRALALSSSRRSCAPHWARQPIRLTRLRDPRRGSSACRTLRAGDATVVARTDTTALACPPTSWTPASAAPPRPSPSRSPPAAAAARRT